MIEYIDELDSLKLQQNNGIYERQETKLIRALLKPTDIFVDVGAHIGYHSIIAAEIIRSGKVYAFEPQFVNYELLIKNIKRFRNVSCFQLAIGDQNVMGNIYWSAKNSGDHRVYETKNELRRRDFVNIKTIDNCLKKEKEEKIDFLKIDTQGYEIKVLKGARKLLRNSPNLNMLIEYSPKHLKLAGHNPGELIALLINLKFNIYAKNNGKWIYANSTHFIPRKPKHTNFFCSRKRIEEIKELQEIEEKES